MRDISEGSLPEDFVKDPSKLESPVVVQIQKIRNVSAPKANEESTSAPRMLKLTLHDGKVTCTGLEISHIPSLSINTPPGTKLLLKNEELEVCHGVVWLTPSVISVLGGTVSHMIEKWELNRSLAKHTRGKQNNKINFYLINFIQQLNNLNVMFLQLILFLKCQYISLLLELAYH